MTKFSLLTKVKKGHADGNSTLTWWWISVEVNGFEGSGDGSSVGYAFEHAYEDAMAKLAEGTSQ